MSADDRQLSPSGRRAVLRVAEILRRGFTGQIVLECNDGGVHWIEYPVREHTSDMGVDAEQEVAHVPD